MILDYCKVSIKLTDVRSSTCPLTDFFWLLSHVIYLKLTKVSYECLLSQRWVMGSRASFSVPQQLRPEHSSKWMLLIFSDLPFTRKTEKPVNFSMLKIFELQNWCFVQFHDSKICNIEKFTLFSAFSEKIESIHFAKSSNKFCYPSLTFGKEDTHMILLSA